MRLSREAAVAAADASVESIDDDEDDSLGGGGRQQQQQQQHISKLDEAEIRRSIIRAHSTPYSASTRLVFTLDLDCLTVEYPVHT